MTEDTPAAVKRLVSSSWAEGTRAGYDSQLKKWVTFCASMGISEPRFTDGLAFLVHMHDNLKASYSLVATARSALSAVLPLQNGTTFGDDPVVSKTIRGMLRNDQDYHVKWLSTTQMWF